MGLILPNQQQTPMEILKAEMTSVGLPSKFTDETIEEIIGKYSQKKSISETDAIETVRKVVQAVASNAIDNNAARTMISGMRTGLTPSVVIETTTPQVDRPRLIIPG
jgi:hypothetical protein